MIKKLVRDRIPEIIKKDGKNPITRIADRDEYKKELKKKLLEEIKEFYESNEQEELSDILEVVYSIIESEGFSIEDIEKIRKEKVKKRGSFGKRIILEKVE